MLERRNSSALAMEFRLPGINPYGSPSRASCRASIVSIFAVDWLCYDNAIVLFCKIPETYACISGEACVSSARYAQTMPGDDVACASWHRSPLVAVTRLTALRVTGIQGECVIDTKVTLATFNHVLAVTLTSYNITSTRRYQGSGGITVTRQTAVSFRTVKTKGIGCAGNTPSTLHIGFARTLPSIVSTCCCLAGRSAVGVTITLILAAILLEVVVVQCIVTRLTLVARGPDHVWFAVAVTGSGVTWGIVGAFRVASTRGTALRIADIHAVCALHTLVTEPTCGNQMISCQLNTTLENRMTYIMKITSLRSIFYLDVTRMKRENETRTRQNPTRYGTVSVVVILVPIICQTLYIWS